MGMTSKDYFDVNFTDILPAFSVGTDRWLQTMRGLQDTAKRTAASTYPPYNIIKYLDKSWKIELAVAGFAEDELEVTLEDDKFGNKLLEIKGTKKTGDTLPDDAYLWRGLALRDFKKTFTLTPDVVIDWCEYRSGLLQICLRLTEQTSNKQKIEIGGTRKSTGKPYNTTTKNNGVDFET